MVLRSLGGGGLLSRSFALASRRGAALTPALGGARRQMGVVVGSPPPDEVDALIIGGGVMGASVAVMLKLLHPTWNIRLIEQLDRVGGESSNEWRNAGTGHAALCEPNYTPMMANGEVDVSSAVAINQKFLVGVQWWCWLAEKGILPDTAFIQPANHCTFVHGDDNIHWLKKRVEALKKLPSFAAMEYSEDYDTIKEWVPHICSGRPRNGEKIAMSRHPDGTECNYGLLTRQLVQSFSELGGTVQVLSKATELKQMADKRWVVRVQKDDLSRDINYLTTKFVFAGAGGGALKVLQMSGIPEVQGYAGMPVSGKFLVCQTPSGVAKQGTNKVYGRAELGAPPMSVPHLDWRTIYGRDCVFFGPFAGFSPVVMHQAGFLSSAMEWLSTFNLRNIYPTISMALANLDLVQYLFGEVMASKEHQLAQLRKFVPDARPEDWTMVTAGQRVQVIQPDKDVGGKLVFGTKVMASADNTIVGLMGASPGASISPHVAIEVIEHFESAKNNTMAYHAALAQMIPSYGRDINAEPGLYESIINRARATLLKEELLSSKVNIGKVFDRLDENSDGTLSMAELKVFLEAQGIDKKTTENLFKVLDADGTGEITRKEFTAGFSAFCTGQLTKYHYVREMERSDGEGVRAKTTRSAEV